MKPHLILLLAGLGVIAGCSTTPCCNTPAKVVVGPCGTTACVTPVAAQKIVATGYGNTGSYGQYTTGQAKLMAMRAAKVDALRNLAEQVHGVRVWGNTAVSAFVTQNDTVRTYVDSFIRGARVINMTAVADGNYEATVELELTTQFFECLVSSGSCSVAAMPQTLVSPSVSYVSN